MACERGEVLNAMLLACAGDGTGGTTVQVRPYCAPCAAPQVQHVPSALHAMVNCLCHDKGYCIRTQPCMRPLAANACPAHPRTGTTGCSRSAPLCLSLLPPPTLCPGHAQAAVLWRGAGHVGAQRQQRADAGGGCQRRGSTWCTVRGGRNRRAAGKPGRQHVGCCAVSVLTRVGGAGLQVAGVLAQACTRSLRSSGHRFYAPGMQCS